MPLGYGLEPNLVKVGDTADLSAVWYDVNDKPRDAAGLVSVVFTVQYPDATQTTVTGTITADGSALALFTATTQVGHYRIVATFTDSTGRIKSVRCDIEVQDPFDDSPDLSPTYLVATQIWAKIEDCFDTEAGGPWLTEMTQNVFNRQKMESFLDMALFDINQLNPPTSLALSDFVFTNPTTGEVSATADLPLVVQGGFLVCLRHLMTAYVEQPQPTGAQIAWQDRRDYLSRWTSIYTIEFAVYDRMVKLYKRKYLGLGRTAGLISSKAGRLIPAPMRTQNIGRGYW